MSSVSLGVKKTKHFRCKLTKAIVYPARFKVAVNTQPLISTGLLNMQN
jgi:hypothetical protein